MAERIVIEIDGDASGAQRAAQSAERAVRGVGQASAQSSRQGAAFSAMAAKQRQSLGQLATTAKRTGLVLGTVMAGATAHLIRAGADFEQQMAGVKAVTGATAQEMQRLDEVAKQLGADTKFSAGEAAQAMYELASAGFSVNESIDALPGVMDLAAAGGIELADAAEISSKALRGFKLDTEESGKVADIMAQAVNSSSLKMGDLQQSMKNIAAAGSATGQSIEEMTAAVSLMVDAGLRGDEAGTALRSGLLRLTEPSKDVSDGLRTMGLSAQDLYGPKGLKPLGEIIALIEDGTKDLDKSTRNAAVTQIFGIEAFSGMVNVLDAGAPKLDKLTRAYERSDGTAKKTADTMNATVKGAFDEVKGSIETVEIALFQRFQEPLRRAMQSAAGAVNREGKQVEQFFDRVMDTPEFQTADWKGQVQILSRAIKEEIDRAELPAKLGDAFSKALPVMARAAGMAALGAAKAFGQGFIAADPLGRMVMATWLLSKTGGLAAFRAAGASSGGAFGGAFAPAAATGVGKSTALRGALVAQARAIGPLAGVAFAVAFAPEAAKAYKEASSSKSPEFKLPKNKGIDFGPLNQIVAPFKSAFNAINKDDGAEKKLKSFGDTAEKAFRKLSKAKDVRGLAKLADEARALGKEFPQAAPELTKFADEVSEASRSMIGGLEDVSLLGGQHLSDIRGATDYATGRIRKAMRDPRTGAATTAFSLNFQAAAKAVQTSMDEGVISTETGTEEIYTLLTKSMRGFGFTDKEIKAQLLTPTPRKSSEKGSGKARGGFFLGQPGAKGHDSIPMLVNGQRVIAAEGEYVGIFNRHQQKALNQRLADQGGLSGFMSANNRPHHMASGGIIPAAAGMVTGDTDYLPEVGKRLRAMSAATNTPIFVQSGGRTLAEQAALYARFRAGTGNLAAPPNANAPHVRGVAADITPGRERFGSIAGRFGLGFTVPSESWHVELLGAAVASGAITAAEAEKLERVMWDGPGGALGAIGQRGLDAVRSAAQSKLDAAFAEQSAMSGDPAGGSSFPGPSATGGGGGDYKSYARSLFGRFGWGSEQFPPLDSLWTHESGWDPQARNPKSGAFGIPQSLPGSKMASAGPDWQTNGNTQIRWGLGYIKSEYGAPSGAWGHFQAENWYSQGGIIPAEGGLLAGASAKKKTDPKRKKKKAPKKKPAPKKGALASKLKTKLPSPIFDAIARLVGDESKMGSISVHDTMLAQMRREHGRSDEAARIAELDETNPDGSYKVPQGQADAVFAAQVQRAVGELYAEYGVADKLVAFHDDPQRGLLALRTAAISQLEAGVAERRTREQEIIATTRANAQEIDSELKVFHGLTRRIREAKKKKRSKATVRGLQREQDETARRISRLRNDRQRLIGTRSTQTSLDEAQAPDQGMLGATRTGLRTFRDELPTQRRDLQQDTFSWKDRVGDRQDISDQVAEWQARRPQPRATVDSGPTAQDSQLADLYKQQAQEAARRANLSEGLLGVFQGMAPLLGQRLVGAFAQGTDRVPRTGLALVHKDETILPDPQGAFGLDQRTTSREAPSVTVYVSGDLGPLMGKVRAEIDGRAARVVSRDLGRRQRMIGVAPGGR